MSNMHDDLPIDEDVGNDSAEFHLSDQLDPEAQLLCALMWSKSASEDVVYIASYLNVEDFYKPLYGFIFTLIQTAITEGTPCDPTSLNSRILASPTGKVDKEVYQKLLLGLTGLATTSANAIFYADQVLGTAYRRQFFAMTQDLQACAERDDEDKLFDRLLDHGRRQRQAKSRRQNFLAHVPSRVAKHSISIKPREGLTKTNARQR